MNRNLKMVVALAALAIMVGAANAASAQMVGGYKTVEATDEYARAAAEWAVREKGEKTKTGIELLSLVKAERQTVQGANYRLCMKINTEGRDEPVSFVQAVVYMDLKKNYKLTSWAASACAAATPSPARPPVAGGYKSVETTDERARAAAEWAVREKGEKAGAGIELMTLVKAEQQVVQGMNYRLCMKINTEGADEPVSFVEAVVYMDLKMNYKLSSWQAASKCGSE
jgi:Aspartic acid proteinase inhibitor